MKFKLKDKGKHSTFYALPYVSYMWLSSLNLWWLLSLRHCGVNWVSQGSVKYQSGGQLGNYFIVMWLQIRLGICVSQIVKIERGLAKLLQK